MPTTDIPAPLPGDEFDLGETYAACDAASVEGNPYAPSARARACEEFAAMSRTALPAAIRLLAAERRRVAELERLLKQARKVADDAGYLLYSQIDECRACVALVREIDAALGEAKEAPK